MPILQYDFNVNVDDLKFILNQIRIAEDTTTAEGGIEGLAERVGSPLLPYGIRTVDGTWNSLLPGQERMGAADNVMPRIVAGTFHTAETSPANFFFPGQPAGTTPTSYEQSAPGNMVFDSQPRVISNLIADQTANNPAAVAAAQARADEATYPGMGEVQVSENGTLFIPNHSPDLGLSPPFNSAMTIFGQFFDHGLDLITKGGGTVFVPLKPDDPLYVEGSPTNFMVLSRAVNTVGPGPDGEMGTADDDTRGHTNTTTPFVDQNQTYTSHPSHQVFLREYVMVEGKPLATGRLLDGEYGAGNWADVTQQAAERLGVQLTDQDVFNVPLLATDRYGEFLRGPNGYVQMVTATGLVEGDPLANGGLGIAVPEDVVRTGHEFLVDIAHSAAPTGNLVADEDTTLGSVQNPDYDPTLPISATNPLHLPQAQGTYDDEMLDRHFINGDGRGNENIALTAIHAVFHSEHNRLVEQYKETIVANGDLAFLNEWLASPVTELPATPEALAALVWDGERLFQAGRFATEMQYQHMVFEEFARTVSPTIDPFFFSNSPELNPAIMEEFANVVYRFGHSMLTETVARTDGQMNSYDIGLIEAFLNPPEFNVGGITQEQAIADIMLGMSRQVGNEIDEFVTEALRNNLVGLPLDLATINIARARETGAPTFNMAREEFYAQTGDAQFAPYTSWADLAPHLKNPMSVINFIAAYGQHENIASQETADAKRAAATVMVLGAPIDINNDGDTADAGETAAADRVAFLNGQGTWDRAASGVDDIDFWIGGLAEAKTEFSGMLGPTFNHVFESQLENLQEGDRFYYLSRTQGMNMLNELEANTFSKMVMRNSELGDGEAPHLSSLLFATPSYTLEVDQSLQRTGIVGPDGTTLNGDPERDDPVLNAFNPLVVRADAADEAGAPLPYNQLLDLDGDGTTEYDHLLSFSFESGEHVVLGGTAGNDILLSGRGLDAVWGDEGDDYIDAGDSPDQVHGGDGDDIIVDHGTEVGAADFLRGDAGNDVISGGAGNDVVFGGADQDFILTGQDFTEVFAGTGNDFVMGANGADILMGNEGDDWIEGREGFDELIGDNSELFFNSPIIGHDVLNGGGNDTDYDGESGDDIMVQSTGIQRNDGMFGFDWAIHKGDPLAANSDLGIPFFPAQQNDILRDRFDSVEALSGWEFDDVLTGAAIVRDEAAGGPGVPLIPLDESHLKSQNVGLIDGYAELLGYTEEEIAAMPVDTTIIDPTAGAEVIIGGGGSDTIRGNRGDDIIDGDAWLNVRIRVTANVGDANTQENEILTVDSMAELTPDMLSREINPGQLHIVREILQSETAATDVDVAVYSGGFEEYTVTRNEDGTVQVAHTAPVLAADDDGTDMLRNIEQLHFLDRVVSLGLAIDSNGGGDTAALQVLENTLAVTQVTVTGADPLQPLLFLLEGADADFFDLNALDGTLAFLGAPNFEDPLDAGGDNVYDVVISVSDGIVSDSQALAISVLNDDDAATGALRIGSYTQTSTAAALTAASTLVDEDATGLDATFQWQQLVGDVWTDIAGATNATLANQSNTTTRVVTTYDDGFGVKTVVSQNTAIVGTSAANTLAGTAGEDLLLGLGGADTLSAGLGDDVVDGGAGNDLFMAAAGDGNDQYIGGGGAADRYNLASTNAGAIVDLTAGTSSSAETGSDTLATIENVTGSQGGDTMTDGAGRNVLTGGAGADTFILGADNVRDVVNGAGGINTVVYSSHTADLTVTLANGAVVGGSGDTALTSDTITNIRNFTGGSGDDSITGNNAGNQILGGGGDDTLAGGGGVDVMNGEAGDDLLLASGANDQIIGGDGNDTYSLAATSAAATVNLTTGTSSSAQTGNDTLSSIENVVGSSGGDTITDGAGENRLTGGAGEDRFVLTVDDARDTIDGLGGGNTADYTAFTTDLVVTVGDGAVVGGSGTTAATSDVLTNVDHFTGGGGNDSITGDGAVNRLTGGAGADTIDGAGGNDVLAGGLGDDVLEGGAGNDSLAGNAGNDVLHGEAGNDSLDGGDGADTLHGGLGSDVSTGGGGADVFDFDSIPEIPNEAPALRDRVNDFASGTDKLDFNTIDANENAAGNQDFTFSTTAGDGFSADGQLRYHLEDPGSIMQGNVGQSNGLVTDMQVALVGVTTLQAADVVL